jgi:hypothetical protein
MGRTELLDEESDDTTDLRDEDIANKTQDPDSVIRRGIHLTNDVTQADLTKYPDHQLTSRLAYYDRQAVFERSPKLRKQFQAEVQRTQIEINRRKMYARKEAERVFEL